MQQNRRPKAALEQALVQKGIQSGRLYRYAKSSLTRRACRHVKFNKRTLHGDQCCAMALLRGKGLDNCLSITALNVRGNKKPLTKKKEEGLLHRQDFHDTSDESETTHRFLIYERWARWRDTFYQLECFFLSSERLVFFPTGVIFVSLDCFPCFTRFFLDWIFSTD